MCARRLSSSHIDGSNFLPGAHLVYHRKGHGARQREILRRRKADEERERKARQKQAQHELAQAQAQADMRAKLERWRHGLTSTYTDYPSYEKTEYANKRRADALKSGDDFDSDEDSADEDDASSGSATGLEDSQDSDDQDDGSSRSDSDERSSKNDASATIARVATSASPTGRPLKPPEVGGWILADSLGGDTHNAPRIVGWLQDADGQPGPPEGEGPPMGSRPWKFRTKWAHELQGDHDSTKPPAPLASGWKLCKITLSKVGKKDKNETEEEWAHREGSAPDDLTAAVEAAAVKGGDKWLAEAAQVVVKLVGLPPPPRDCGGVSPPAYECADYLPFISIRYDHPIDRQLTFLAPEALCAPVPEDWSEHFEPDFGMVFYRKLKGKGKRRDADEAWMTWRHPLDNHFHELVPHLHSLGGRMERLLRPGHARESHSRVAPDIAGELTIGDQSFWGEMEQDAERTILARQIAAAWRHHAELIGGLVAKEGLGRSAARARRFRPPSGSRLAFRKGLDDPRQEKLQSDFDHDATADMNTSKLATHVLQYGDRIAATSVATTFTRALIAVAISGQPPEPEPEPETEPEKEPEEKPEEKEEIVDLDEKVTGPGMKLSAELRAAVAKARRADHKGNEAEAWALFESATEGIKEYLRDKQNQSKRKTVAPLLKELMGRQEVLLKKKVKQEKKAAKLAAQRERERREQEEAAAAEEEDDGPDMGAGFAAAAKTAYRLYVQSAPVLHDSWPYGLRVTTSPGNHDWVHWAWDERAEGALRWQGSRVMGDKLGGVSLQPGGQYPGTAVSQAQELLTRGALLQHLAIKAMTHSLSPVFLQEETLKLEESLRGESETPLKRGGRKKRLTKEQKKAAELEAKIAAAKEADEDAWNQAWGCRWQRARRRQLALRDAELARAGSEGHLTRHLIVEESAWLEQDDYTPARPPDLVLQPLKRGRVRYLALHYALQQNAPPAVLIRMIHADDFEWELDEVDEDGHRPLHLALLLQQRPDVVLALLTANPSICRVKSGDGEIPLHIALRMRAPEQVLLALIDTYHPEEDEDIEEAEALQSRTARLTAMADSVGDEEAIQEMTREQRDLASLGVDVQVRTSYGNMTIGAEEQHDGSSNSPPRLHRHKQQPLVQAQAAEPSQHFSTGGISAISNIGDISRDDNGSSMTAQLSDAEGLLTQHVANGGGVVDTVIEEVQDRADGIIYDPQLRSLVDEFGGRAALFALAKESEDPTMVKLASETLAMLAADQAFQRRLPTQEATAQVAALRRSLNFKHSEASLIAQYERDAEAGRLAAAKLAEQKAKEQEKKEIFKAVLAEQSSRRIARLEIRQEREKDKAARALTRKNRRDARCMTNLPEAGGTEVESVTKRPNLSTSAYIGLRARKRSVDPVELLASAWARNNTTIPPMLAEQPSHQQDVRVLLRRRKPQLRPVAVSSRRSILTAAAEDLEKSDTSDTKKKKKKQKKGKRKTRKGAGDSSSQTSKASSAAPPRQLVPV